MKPSSLETVRNFTALAHAAVAGLDQTDRAERSDRGAGISDSGSDGGVEPVLSLG